jgi:long-chain acyl-CoA synthetase
MIGSDLPAGESGEIVIRGPNVMLGYWNRPEETAEAIRDGWFRTGDIGRKDDNGYFFLEDRLKDMVNVGGMKVFPAEVENVLLQYPGVADVAVFGVSNQLFGERVIASVVLKSEQLIALRRCGLSAVRESPATRFPMRLKSSMPFHEIPRKSSEARAARSILSKNRRDRPGPRGLP